MHYVEFDAFGRVTSTRFWGTELQDGTEVQRGFSPPSAKPFTAPDDIDDAIDLESESLPVAQFNIYQPYSWMIAPCTGFINEWLDDLKYRQELAITHPEELSVEWINEPVLTREILIQSQFITEEGYLWTLGSRRWLRQSKYPLSENMTSEIQFAFRRHPPHAMTVVTDRYDTDTEQQHQQVIVFSDGFGRALQSVHRVEPGEAYVCDENGNLTHDENGGPMVNTAGQRWAVSGRVVITGAISVMTALVRIPTPIPTSMTHSGEKSR